VATNGRDGINAAIGEQPALILLDNRLPDATGTDVLHQLASAKATAGIPVVIVSGDSGQATASELLALGASGFLAKPFDIHELIAIDRYLPCASPVASARIVGYLASVELTLSNHGQRR
jgi:DNA-binding response OmpR family regulator